jgi:hypothetical protein
VTGRLNIVNRPPDRCAMHPLIVQVHNTKILGAVRLWNAADERRVQDLGKDPVKTQVRDG